MKKLKAIPSLGSEDNSFNTLFYLSPIGMAISTMSDGRFIEVNDPYCEITGYSRDQLIGSSSIELKLLSAKDREVILENVTRMGFMKNLDINLNTISGETKIVATSIHHTEFNGQECLISTLMDITERKRMEDELRYLAQTDVLSGLSNRYHFMQLAEIEISRCIRSKENMSLMLIDIDNFKNINDTYGHQTGDIVIHELGRLCQSTFRKIDIIGRIGGEEFAIALPLSSVSSALKVAERLRQTVAFAQIPLEQSTSVLQFTISIGITAFVDQIDCLPVMLAQADQALYQAKNSGRNCICVYN